MTLSISSLSFDQYRIKLFESFQACGIPRVVWEALADYVLYGKPLGNFLYGVITCDLRQAVKAADELHIQRLRDYVAVLEGVLPLHCWGSVAAYTAWKRKGGLVGQGKEPQDLAIIAP